MKASEGGANSQDCAIAYDFENNLFYSFKTQTDDTRLEAFTLANFKKGGATSGFDREYLNKRFAKFKAVVYGEELAKESGKTP